MSRIRYFARETWTNIRRNLTLTFAAILTVAVGVMLVGMGLMAGYASGNALDRWEGGVQFEVFLNPQIDPSQLDALGIELQTHPEIDRIEFFSAEEAYALVSQQMADQPELLAQVSPEALPASYRVVPRSVEAELIESLAAQFRQRPGVMSVQTGREEVDAIRTWFTSFQGIVLLLSIVLSGASVMLIFNSIRVAMFARRREIEVMKLVGATNGFIRFPFMLEGMLHGLIGGIIGAIAAGALRGHVEGLFSRSDILAFFRSFVVTSDQFTTVVIVTVIAGVLVGMIGSAFAASRFLDV
ncbi:MAG: ABC transporter permease [Acidimicrobiales bacterium]|nr:ABC transporter permease [Acidimicrobiales bacterium]MYG87705.1 ABC transporter permease [Acidimicrobiales bacterium]MYI28956.1 ABC transporter permease [Acidimicrobiales bacterium]